MPSQEASRIASSRELGARTIGQESIVHVSYQHQSHNGGTVDVNIRLASGVYVALLSGPEIREIDRAWGLWILREFDDDASETLF